jgi:GNAT superfamily N-acetyltransferase
LTPQQRLDNRIKSGRDSANNDIYLFAMTTYNIRAATTDDAAALSALIQGVVRTSNSRDYNPATIELICANFTHNKILSKMAQRDVFVAVHFSEIVGTVSLGNGKLHSMFVEPKRQGLGIGRRLVRHLERHAFNSGLSALQLSSSITAKPFYEKLGYQLVTFEERPGGSTFLMRKSLNDPPELQSEAMVIIRRGEAD